MWAYFLKMNINGLLKHKYWITGFQNINEQCVLDPENVCVINTVFVWWGYYHNDLFIPRLTRGRFSLLQSAGFEHIGWLKFTDPVIKKKLLNSHRPKE